LHFGSPFEQRYLDFQRARAHSNQQARQIDAERDSALSVQQRRRTEEQANREYVKAAFEGMPGIANSIANDDTLSTDTRNRLLATVTRSQPGAGWRDAGCGVTPSAEMAAGKAASNGSRSNGSAPKKPISNGVAPDTSPYGTTARDDTAPETSPPAIVTPPEPTPGGATVAALIAEFEEARQLALEVKQPAAAVSATMSKARISGLLGEKADAKPGDGPLEMSDLEMARRMGLLLARGLRNMPGEASH
jgi:hypothetical protein